MSKQQRDVEKNLKIFFPLMETEIELQKITKNLFHKGIRVDIWIPEINCIVEVHGIQHHKPSGFGQNKVDTLMQFNKQLNRDHKLVEACKQYKINYEQIDYTEEVDHITLFRRFTKYGTDGI